MKHQFTGTLLQLQRNIKRDAEAYLPDFQTQLRHFESYLQLFELKPSESPKAFLELLSFLSQTGPLYPEECKHIPPMLTRLLEAHLDTLQTETRSQIVSALFIFRTKNIIDCETLLPICMKLFDIPDRVMRQQVFSNLVVDIKNTNQRKKDRAVNGRLQSALFSLVKQDEAIPSYYALMLLIELYRRKIWTSDQVVNAIAGACFSRHARVQMTAMKFLLGQYKLRLRLQNEKAEEEAEDDTAKIENERMETGRKARHSKLTKKRLTKDARNLQSIKRRLRDANEHVDTIFAPVYVIYDPQGFAERLFDNLAKTRERFEYRLVIMSVISRLIAAHQLLLLNWYSYLERYVEPQITKVTLVLSLAAQSVHDLVPPDTIEPLVRTIANNFVDDKRHPDVIILGINTIREMAKRQPLVMTKELVMEFSEYQKSKDRGVMKAARGIINLYRELNPTLLHRSDRAHDVTRTDAELPGFGASKAIDQIPGVELLYQYEMEHDIPLKRLKRQQRMARQNAGAEKQSAVATAVNSSLDDLYMKDDEWEVASDASTDNDWIDVDDDGEDVPGQSDDEGGEQENEWVTDEDDDGEKAEAGEEEEVEVDDEDEDGEEGDEGEESEGEEGDDQDGAESDNSAPDLIPVDNPEPAPESDARTRILTPLDFARIAKLREALEHDPRGRRVLREQERKRKILETDESVNPDTLEYYTAKRQKISREQKLTDRAFLRDKHKLKHHKKTGKGKTHKQKQKAKPGKLTLHKPDIRRKMKQSIAERKSSQKRGEKSFVKFMMRKGGR